jgi:hypothetical protein
MKARSSSLNSECNIQYSSRFRLLSLTPNFGGSSSVVKETELRVEFLGSLLLSAVGLAAIRDGVFSAPAANQHQCCRGL